MSFRELVENISIQNAYCIMYGDEEIHGKHFENDFIDEYDILKIENIIGKNNTVTSMYCFDGEMYIIIHCI